MLYCKYREHKWQQRIMDGFRTFLLVVTPGSDLESLPAQNNQAPRSVEISSRIPGFALLLPLF